MRVLFVTSTFPDYPGSPRGAFISELATALSERGVEPAVVTPQMLHRSAPVEAWGGGIPVWRFAFGSENRQLADYAGVPRLLMVRYLAHGLRATLQAIADWEPELIHGHWVVPTGLLAAVAARLTGRPVVLSAHGSDLLVWARRSGLIRSLCRWTLNQCAQCSANSVALRDAVIELGVPVARVPVVYEMGVDSTRFHPGHSGDAWRRRVGAQPDDCVVLHVGHLVERKGVDVLIQAVAGIAARQPQVRLVIAGEGPERRALEALAERSAPRGRTHFLGAVNHDEVHGLFAAADLFALASRNEAMGIVLLEAMASGRPIVATRVDGIPDLVIEGETGLLAAPENPGAFGEQLERLVTDQELRRRMGARGREEVARRFQPSQQVERILALYQEARLSHVVDHA